LFQVLPVPANRQRLDRLPPPLPSVSAMGPNHAHLQHSYSRVHSPNKHYTQSRYAFIEDTSPWDSNRLSSFHCFLAGWRPHPFVINFQSSCFCIETSSYIVILLFLVSSTLIDTFSGYVSSIILCKCHAFSLFPLIPGDLSRLASFLNSISPF